MAYTRAPISFSTNPAEPNLQNCIPKESLPEGFTLESTGELKYERIPDRTIPHTQISVFCLDSNRIPTESILVFEVRGYDWVKSLSATGFESPGRDVAIISDTAIGFLTYTINNGSNLATDFGQNVIKNSSPIPGTSLSPLIIKLNAEGNLLQTRILGGVSFQNVMRLGVDSQQNIYTLSSLSGSTLQVNADPEFGGTAINKLPIAPAPNDNFLLSQIRSDGSFGFAVTVSANSTSKTASICYNPKFNTILANGFANGTSQNLGIDFGIMDTTTQPLGFQLEITPEKSYIRSRKFLGSTHHVLAIHCRSDGSYVLGMQQVTPTLDYRQTFDGISDIKTVLGSGNGVGLTSIDGNGNYLFTKIFSNVSFASIPIGVTQDDIGNNFVLFNSSGGNYDLRVGVDGVSDIKPSTAGINAGYLVNLNSDGSYAWGKMMQGSVNLALTSLAIHPTRKSIFILGSFTGTNIDFFSDFGVSLPLSSQAANQNPILIEINSETGSLITARMIAQSPSSLPFVSMKFDSVGNLYLIGDYRVSSNFQYGTDGGILSKSHTYGTGIQQALFVKMRP